VRLSNHKSCLSIVAALAAALGAAAASAATLTTLASFNGRDGQNPYAALIADKAGNLYGTTAAGGAGHLGTIFKLPAGSHAITDLASFNGNDGAGPRSGLIAGKAGDLYGTTQSGGPKNLGTVYKLSAGSGDITDLAWFDGSDGQAPFGGLVFDKAGNLFGTTLQDWANGTDTVFEIAAGANKITTLATFQADTGAGCEGRLLADAAGNLYGTTQSGGANNVGAVFEMVAGSGTVTDLAWFRGSNGQLPLAGLIADKAGNLYGTTDGGGADDYGTVFEVAAGSGTITTLASFDYKDGAFPNCRLIADAAGNLYGTTFSGGAGGDGTIFEIPAGSRTIVTLASFKGGNGSGPQAGLIADKAGNLYGTTVFGGANGDGTIFELTDTGFVASARPHATAIGRDLSRGSRG
jgi:uncharacterized repeat protein (TIGR03803 family)